MENNIQIILEIYKVYVDSMEKVAARRQVSNNFFLAINSSIFLGSAFGTSTYELNILSYLSISVVGILLCLLWIKVNKNFNSLNTVKFKVIHKLEAKLPFGPFQDEWLELKEGKDQIDYKPFSLIEFKVAQLFILLYTVHFLINLFNYLC